ncbi:MAG TPA: tetratricopeptide repeat protein [Fluviicola sp.]|nr:tetratricopeptide repeat protein [Fluviicola sp.]
MKTFREGDVFFRQENGDYTVYKVIASGENNQLYTTVFWPVDVKPTPENRKSFDLRTACEVFQIPGSEVMTFLANEPVSAAEQEEYANFKRIESGLRQRTENLVVILERGALLLKEGKTEEALSLFTEATSYSKYNHHIFDQRGYCLLKLGRYSEAIADLEHSLTIQPEGKDTLFYCAEAYYRAGRFDQAQTKIRQLQIIAPDYPGLRELAKKYRK